MERRTDEWGAEGPDGCVGRGSGRKRGCGGGGCRTDSGKTRRGKTVLTSDLCKADLFCFHLTGLCHVAVSLFCVVRLLLHVFNATLYHSLKKKKKQIELS